jgi:hypothetical protein
MKKALAVTITFILITGCATSNQNPDRPRTDHGLGSAFVGITHLILSPIQIATGLLEGIAALPYFLSTNTHEINRSMIEAQAAITLDDTYETAYGKRLAQVPDTGDTGEVFRRMKHASVYFQKVLKTYGIHDADRFFLTSIDTANSKGYTLFAVVYRPQDNIQVADKYDRKIKRTFHRTDRMFYEPFAKDIHGNNLDTIIDWAGIPRDYIKTQKAQAILITMAANSVISQRSNPDYWEAEQRWIAGDYKQITEQKTVEVRKKLKI